MMVSALWSGGTVAARSLQRLDFLRHEPIAAVHHAATFDIFLMGEVAQPYRGDAIRGPIVAHESFDHNVELGLTLIAFGWHPTASFRGGPTRTDLGPRRHVCAPLC